MKTFVARGLAAATFLATPLAFAAPPTIGGCQVFPANNHWNTPIDGLPVTTQGHLPSVADTGWQPVK